MSQYAADGLMGMSNMFVLSTQGFRSLLPEYVAARSSQKRLLDVGAGDGGVTAHLAPLFDSVTATEVQAHSEIASKPLVNHSWTAGLFCAVVEVVHKASI